VRSLRLKFSALVATLLIAASIGLTWIATWRMRAALEDEWRGYGATLATNLAGDAKIPLLEGDELSMGALVQQVREALVQQVGEREGLVAARLVQRERSDSGEIVEKIVASLDSEELDEEMDLLAWKSAEEPSQTVIERRGGHLLVATRVIYSGQWLGEARIELDLGVLVEPVVARTQRLFLVLAFAVVLLGILGGDRLVKLLLGPIRRLRSGVERVAAGDLVTPVTPTSRDEAGDLTRAFNKMREKLQERERIQKEKERIQKAFGRYASDTVLEFVLKSSGESEMEGAEHEVTIVFADIRSFTRLSEGMKAHDVVALLNEIFQLASDRIDARKGTIDKFIGDSVMAYFGAPVPDAPVPDPDHAVHAVSAAVDIVQAVGERNQQLGADGHRVQVGIGIHTGTVVVGTLGSDKRTDFTAVGDAVNVAHRLEKLARPGEILVSEAVQQQVRGTVKLRFEGERQLSGRVEPVHVYSVDRSPPPAKAV
jgi:class 3 adenylate cyclase